MKKSFEDRERASLILAKEVSDIMVKRLSQHWTLEQVRWTRGVWTSGVWRRSWTVKLENSTVAIMNVNSCEWGAALVVRPSQHEKFRMFTHQFKLYKTDSPRWIACLLVEWLKQAQIIQVMSI